MSDDDKPQQEPPSLRGTVELPRVVLGSDEAARRAPRERVLPGRVDLRWLSYPAYVACILGAGITVNFAIDSREWAAGPVALAWTMLLFWEWIYGVAYHYRRRVLKYGALLLIAGLTFALAALCMERAQAQWVVAGGELVERGRVAGLEGAALLTSLSGVLVAAHAVVLGRGYRRIKGRATTSG
jgi:hypothetical protein